MGTASPRTNVTNASDDQQIIKGNYSSINAKAAKAEMDDLDGQKDGWMDCLAWVGLSVGGGPAARSYEILMPGNTLI